VTLANRIQEIYRASDSLFQRTPVDPTGPVYAFVPAHGDSKVGAVQELLGRTWSEDFGLAVLLVDFESRGGTGLEVTSHSRVSRTGRLDRRSGSGPNGTSADGKAMHRRDLRRMLEHATQRYQVVCADLTHATDECSLLVLSRAHSIFLVSDSDPVSLGMIRDKMHHFRSLGLEDRCALLLRRTPGGLRPDVAEELAGAPVCGLVETSEQMARLARWLAAPQPDLAATAAVAV
jgi:hypothetical protein